MDPYKDVPSASLTTADGIGITISQGLGGETPWVLVTLSNPEGGKIPIPLVGEECEQVVLALIGHYALAQEARPESA